MAKGVTIPKALAPKPAKPLAPTADKPVTPPAPPTPAAGPSVQDRVNSILNPQMDLLKQQAAQQIAAIQAATQQRQQAIQGYTAQVLQQLQGFAPAIGQDYDKAIGQSQSLAQAGADTLRQANGNQSIQALLGAVGAPDSQKQQVTDQQGNVFNGGAAALFGREGVFPGQQLISDKASSQAFANQLPGINSLAGEAAIRNLLAQSQSQQTDVSNNSTNAIAQLLAKAPELANQFAQDDTSAQQFQTQFDYKKQSDAAAAKASAARAATTAAKQDAYLKLAEAKLGVSANQGNARIKIQAQNAKTTAARVGIEQQNANTSQQRARDAAVAAAARIQIQQQNANTASKKASATKSPAKKAPTATQLLSIVDTAYGGKAGTVRKPVVDAKGVAKTNPSTGAPLYVSTTQRSGQLTYQLAFNRLKALNVPVDQATALLDTKYQRGERGRPWIGLQERGVLKAAGVKAVASYYKKHAFLTPAQASALEAANALPPGEVVNGRYFIQPGY